MLINQGSSGLSSNNTPPSYMNVGININRGKSVRQALVKKISSREEVVITDLLPEQ